MEAHSKLTDTEFVQQLQQCKLDPAAFSHEAHLRLAWINIKQYGLSEAEKNIQHQLQNYVAALGAENKYNKTLTIAAIKMVYHFMLRSKTDDFQEFLVAFPRLKSHFKELLHKHYSFDIFHSEEAKKKYLEPDLLPFD